MGLLTALGLIIGYTDSTGNSGGEAGICQYCDRMGTVQSGTMGCTDDQRYEDLSVWFLIWQFFHDPIQSGRSSSKLPVHVSGEEKWTFQYDRCQYDRWCHAQYGAASGGYGGAGNSKSGLLWTGASGCGGDHRASDWHRDRRSEEEDSGRIGEKDRIIVRKRILCILYP